MEKIKCLICGKVVSNNNSYIGSHTKRVHKILLYDYIQLHYTNLSVDFKFETCGFCNNVAVPNFIINHLNKTYTLNYNNGYKCNTQECRENISLTVFKESYTSKKFEHIGANSLYLSLLHKKNVDDIKYSKSKGFRELKWTTTLPNFIEKYGEKDGTERYKERNRKIGKGNTLLWYIEKYGEKEGTDKYEIYRKKLHKSFGPVKSKQSEIINKILDDHHINYIEEYKYDNENKKNGAIDFYLPEYNIAIEYYGDWWHCNPNYYTKDYFHKICKRFAYEIWESDRIRINHIHEKEFKKKVTILIVWSSTKFTDEYLVNLLNNIKNKNTIIEI